MAERINKLIFETEYKSTGDVSTTVDKISKLQAETKKAKDNTLELVEAENKLRNASLEAGKAVDTQTTKQSEFTKTLQGAGKALNDIGQTNKLSESLKKIKTESADVAKSLKAFEQAARSATTIDELTQSVEQLLAALPEDVRSGAIEMLDDEFEKLDKTIQRPTARLRELKRLIATTDDPELLKAYNEEAGELTDRLGDNNDLIKALASDTFFTDTLVQGAQTAVSAFTAFQGALSLVSEDQEELARAAQKAQGALALLQGTQTLLNELKKSDNIITRAQIATQKIYTAAVGETVGAQKAFRIALLATGIGAIVVAVGLLAANWDKVKIALGGATLEQRRNAEARKEAAAAVAQESAALAIAQSRLSDTNTSQKERVEIIKGLQQQYPAYLSNINAETVSNEKLFAILENVNKALFLKFQIQAREKQLAPLFEARIAAEEELEKRIKATAQTYEGATAQERRLLEQRNSNLADNSQAALQEIDKNIQDIITKINEDTIDLNLLGGDPAKTTEKTKSNLDKILAGSIEFYEQRVSQITERIRKNTVANSEDFFGLLPQLDQAKKDLEEAKKALNEPVDVEVFTQGSLNALNQQASELEKIINNLPKGEELDKAAASLRDVRARIKELQDIIAGPEQAQEKQSQLLELLNEEERYWLASLDIAERGEIEKLETQLAFAKQRKKILEDEGADGLAIQSIENDISLLEQSLAKANEKIVESNKLTTDQLIDGFAQVISAAANAVNQIVALEQQKNDQLIALQQQRVTDAQAVADRGNAAQLNAEQERLNDLNQQQRNFAQQQINIAMIQLAAESALAIAKAASAGGPLAPFTIASTLIALGAGFVAARAQAQAVASQASFRKGGYTGAGDPNTESLALGQKPYKYHNGEYVMNAEVVGIGRNRQIFEEIRQKRIDLQEYFRPSAPQVVVRNDNKDVVKAIEKIPGVSLQINKNGLIKLVESRKSVENKRQSIKKR